MQNIDYSFFFEPVQNQYNKVRFRDHSDGSLLDFEVCLDDSQLRIDGLDTVPSISADLLDLAMAIHAVDRLVKRQKNLPYSFQIELPVRNLDVFLRNAITEKISMLLE
ncbi:MAG: hypothetical protein ISS57_03115 [Anaerolineales bacterium]|nr:hypothetical protein [Anaerolineales bacterium]